MKEGGSIPPACWVILGVALLCLTFFAIPIAILGAIGYGIGDGMTP